MFLFDCQVSISELANLRHAYKMKFEPSICVQFVMEAIVEDVALESHYQANLSLENLMTWFQFSHYLKEDLAQAEKVMTALIAKNSTSFITNYRACGIIPYLALRNFDITSDHPKFTHLNHQDIQFSLLNPTMHVTNYSDFFAYVPQLRPQIYHLHSKTSPLKIEKHLEAILHLMQCQSFATNYSASDIMTFAEKSFPFLPRHISLPMFHYAAVYINTEQSMNFSKHKHCIQQLYNHIFMTQYCKKNGRLYESILATRCELKKRLLNEDVMLHLIRNHLKHVYDALRLRRLCENDEIAASLYELLET